MYNVYNKLIMLLFLENCGLPGYYAASTGNYLPTFRYNLTVPSSRVNNLQRKPDIQIRSLCGERVGGDIIVCYIVFMLDILHERGEISCSA
jgi:hypothetical protein